LNTWLACLCVGLISGSIFLATAPQRELARRELERQDAADAMKQTATAVQIERIKQANALIEEVRGKSR
jgi:hypothetical protein